MTPLHAPDPMGKAAHKAAMLASKLDFKLLGAASPTMTREERSESLIRFFDQYRAFTRAVADLEATAPNAAREGYERDAKTQDFIEARPRA